MVTYKNIPDISWSVTYDAQEEVKTSVLIVEFIDAILKPPANQQTRLFFILPVPSYREPETTLFTALEAEGIHVTKEIRVMKHGYINCYVMNMQQHFQAALPHFFHLGRPELTFIVANCDFNFFVDERVLTDFIDEILKETPISKTYDFLGLHFDSDDLIDCF
jgi:hypothetical protein